MEAGGGGEDAGFEEDCFLGGDGGACEDAELFDCGGGFGGSRG